MPTKPSSYVRISPGATNGAPGFDSAGKALLAILERMERLEEEKQAIAEDQKEVMAEAKSNGWDTAAIRGLLKIRSDDDAAGKLAMLKLYHDRVGMFVWPA